MNDTLRRIKRAVLAGSYRITIKAQLEMSADNLDERDVIECILCAPQINKTIRSTAPSRTRRREYLHIIISETLDGTLVYTKGKLSREEGIDVYYLFVSAKRAV